MKSNKPLSRKKDLVTQEIDGEIMVFDLNINKAFCLNETSSLVWGMCDGNKTVNEISEELSKKLNSPANEDLVWLAIDQLKKEKLIANGEELESRFEGFSRRDVIRRIGLGTMIALPLVSGLVAPTAANAQSGAAVTCPGTNPATCAVGGSGNRANGCRCTATTQCVSGLTCRASTANPTISCCRA